MSYRGKSIKRRQKKPKKRQTIKLFWKRRKNWDLDITRAILWWISNSRKIGIIKNLNSKSMKSKKAY